MLLSNKPVDKFVRRENVERYRRLLSSVTDENRSSASPLFAGANYLASDTCGLPIARDQRFSSRSRDRCSPHTEWIASALSTTSCGETVQLKKEEPPISVSSTAPTCFTPKSTSSESESVVGVCVSPR